MAIPKKGKENKNKPPNNFLRYTGIALQMAITILIGVFGGIKLDEYLEMETPIFTLFLSLASIAAALYFVIKDIGR